MKYRIEPKKPLTDAYCFLYDDKEKAIQAAKDLAEQYSIDVDVWSLVGSVEIKQEWVDKNGWKNG